MILLIDLTYCQSPFCKYPWGDFALQGEKHCDKRTDYLKSRDTHSRVHDLTVANISWTMHACYAVAEVCSTFFAQEWSENVEFHNMVCFFMLFWFRIFSCGGGWYRQQSSHAALLDKYWTKIHLDNMSKGELKEVWCVLLYCNVNNCFS